MDAYKQAKEMEEAQKQLPFPIFGSGEKPDFNRYRVNLLVDHCGSQGAPVIVESNPTYPNLLGRDVVDFIRQASYWAGVNGNQQVKDDDVRRAVEEKIYRSNQLQERMQAITRRGRSTLQSSPG